MMDRLAPVPLMSQPVGRCMMYGSCLLAVDAQPEKVSQQGVIAEPLALGIQRNQQGVEMGKLS